MSDNHKSVALGGERNLVNRRKRESVYMRDKEVAETTPCLSHKRAGGMNRRSPWRKFNPDFFK